MRQVTIKDIAERLKLDKSTVSRALHGSPRVKAATRRAVQDLAEEWGYVPDPLLSALAARRTGQKEQDRGRVIAFLAQGRKGHPEIYGQHIPAAEGRARLRGYRLEVFDMEKFPEPQRLTQVLWNRNVAGLIAGPTQGTKDPWGIDWSRFAAVHSGSGRWSVGLDLCKQDEGGAIHLMFQRTREKGYRRIGMVACVHLPRHVDDSTRIGAALLEMRDCESPDIPVLEIPYAKMGVVDCQLIGNWVLNHRVDAVISNSPATYFQLRDAGFTIPNEIGFACMRGREDAISGLAGCENNFGEVAATAIDLLDSRIRAAEKGLPQLPKCILVPLRWFDGTSLPSRTFDKGLGMGGDPVFDRKSGSSRNFVEK